MGYKTKKIKYYKTLGAIFDAGPGATKPPKILIPTNGQVKALAKSFRKNPTLIIFT